jgi:hypothetical protein
MKKFFTFIGIIALLVVLFILVSGLFLPRDYHFERSIVIQSSKEDVWKNVSLFSNFERWNPWQTKDPDMKQNISGIDGTPGAVYSWSGNKEVRTGTQTFKRLVPYEYIGISLDIKEPFHHQAAVSYRLEQVEHNVKFTWALDCSYSYPMNAVMYLFFDMDDDLDRDFSSGLANLKKLCENNRIMTAFNMQHTSACNNSDPEIR